MSTTFTTQEGYSQKARGTHARVQRVKVTPVPRAGKPGSPLPFEKPSTTTSTPPGTSLTKNCVRCKESANCVKTLQTKLGKIEQLVRNLETTTTKYTEEKTSMHQQQSQPVKQPPPPPQPLPTPNHHRQRLARLNSSRKNPIKILNRGVDLSKLDFSEFQKLVAVTTNTPLPIVPTKAPTIIKLSTTEPMIDVKPTPAIHSDPQHYHISGSGSNSGIGSSSVSLGANVGKSDADEDLAPSSPALSSSTITSQITTASTTNTAAAAAAANNTIGHQSPPINPAIALKRQKSLRQDSGYTSDSEHSNAPSRKHTLSSGLSHAESNNIH